jgi:hypothetical protein
MLDQLLEMVRNNSQQAIVNNPEIPNEQNEDAMGTVLGSVLGGLKNYQSQGGNPNDLMHMLGGMGGNTNGMMSNPVVGGMAQNAIGGLMSRFGLSNSSAGAIVSQVLPMILGTMAARNNNPNDSFNVGGISNVLADGRIDMSDLMNIGGSLFRGGGAGNQQAGGLGGLLGGLFGR